MIANYVQIDPKDNIIVAITDLKQGTIVTIQNTEITLKENIKGKHKFALIDFNTGDEIFMYGVLIGKAMQPISRGSAITVENVKHASADFSATQEKFSWTPPDVSTSEPTEVLVLPIIGWSFH
jgi:altronate hydrolase